MSNKTAVSIDAPHYAAAPGPVWRFSVLLGATGLLLFGLSVWLFWSGLSRMWDWWLELPEYSHAFLIPPVTLFLIWQQKDRLERLSFDGSWWGCLLVLIGGGMLMLGQIGTVYALIEYAYLVTLFGLTLSLTGAPAFRWLLMPLFILLFMVPLPQFLLANLSTRLQLLSSGLGVDIMRVFGVSVFLEGNVIDLGGYKLQVAEACSGLRYLFPLMTLGFLVAYFYKGALWKRIALFLSSIPLTVLMNSFRVGIIGVTVDHWGIGMAEGFLHEFQGWMLFMLCTVLLMGEVALLNRVGHESGTWRQLFGIEFPAPTPRDAPVRQRTVPTSFVASGALLAAFLLVSLLAPRPTEVAPARENLLEFPLQIGAWHGKSQPMEPVYLDALKLDDYLLADYVSGGQPLNLYIAWYNSQRKGEAVHSPRSCLPGGGWQTREFSQRQLDGASVNGHPLQVNRAIMDLGNEHQLVYYWFEQRGRIITNEFTVKWYLFWDALTEHRTDGALVRLMIALPPDGTAEEGDRQLTQFAALIAPQLPRFIPN